jgi:hypothetical protein
MVFLLSDGRLVGFLKKIAGKGGVKTFMGICF